MEVIGRGKPSCDCWNQEIQNVDVKPHGGIHASLSVLFLTWRWRGVSTQVTPHLRWEKSAFRKTSLARKPPKRMRQSGPRRGREAANNTKVVTGDFFCHAGEIRLEPKPHCGTRGLSLLAQAGSTTGIVRTISSALANNGMHARRPSMFYVCVAWRHQATES